MVADRNSAVLVYMFVILDESLTSPTDHRPVKHMQPPKTQREGGAGGRGLMFATTKRPWIVVRSCWSVTTAPSARPARSFLHSAALLTLCIHTAACKQYPTAR